MRPIWHILASLILGILIFIFTHSIGAFLVVLTAGVFIDLDHLVDFWISKPKNPFSVKQFYNMDKYLKSKGDHYTFIFFHSWEIIIILVALTIFWSNIYFYAFILSILLHFMLDIFNLKKTDHILTYFFIFRIFKKFKLNNDNNI